MSLQLSGSSLTIEIKNKKHEILYSHPHIKSLKENITPLINSLQENNFDWKENNNMLVFKLVNSSVLVIKRYKKLSVEEKKNICFQIIEKFIEDEVKQLEITPEMKIVVQEGVDTIIEPIIELSLITLFQKCNLPSLKKVFPCLKRK
jgi:hypothetical protein